MVKRTKDPVFVCKNHLNFFSLFSKFLQYSRMSEIGMQSKLIYKESIHWKSFLLNLVLVNKQIGTTGKHLEPWLYGFFFFLLDFIIHWFSSSFPCYERTTFQIHCGFFHHYHHWMMMMKVVNSFVFRSEWYQYLKLLEVRR